MSITAGVHSPVTGPVQVKVGDVVIKEFGSVRDADKFAMGYNHGWHARESRIALTGVTVGVATHTDDTGLDWCQVVCATDHGDATFAVYPWGFGQPADQPLAMGEGHANWLVGLFEVLGLPVKRGPVDHA